MKLETARENLALLTDWLEARDPREGISPRSLAAAARLAAEAEAALDESAGELPPE